MTTETLERPAKSAKGFYGVVCVVCAQCGAEGPRVSGTFNAGNQGVLVDQATTTALGMGWQNRSVFSQDAGGPRYWTEWRCPAHRHTD